MGRQGENTRNFSGCLECFVEQQLPFGSKDKDVKFGKALDSVWMRQGRGDKETPPPDLKRVAPSGVEFEIGKTSKRVSYRDSDFFRVIRFVNPHENVSAVHLFQGLFNELEGYPGFFWGYRDFWRTDLEKDFWRVFQGCDVGNEFLISGQFQELGGR